MRAATTVVLIAMGVAACGTGSTTSSSGAPPTVPADGGDCTTRECPRALKCKKADCTGAVANVGCCSCPAGYVDELTCTGDGGDAAVQKTVCSPACSSTEICVEPGACSFDAHCVGQAEVTCPDAGLCTTTGCAGELHGAVLACVCR
jgi:hypothetical protein